MSRGNKGLIQVLMRMCSMQSFKVGVLPLGWGLTQDKVACQRADYSKMPKDSRAKLTSVIHVALYPEMKQGYKSNLKHVGNSSWQFLSVFLTEILYHICHSSIEPVFLWGNLFFGSALVKDTPKTSWWIITNNTEPGVSVTAFLKKKKCVI